MSIEIQIITGRKKELSTLLKAVSEFIGGSQNKRISAQVTIKLKPEEKS